MHGPHHFYCVVIRDGERWAVCLPLTCTACFRCKNVDLVLFSSNWKVETSMKVHTITCTWRGQLGQHMACLNWRFPSRHWKYFLVLIDLSPISRAYWMRLDLLAGHLPKISSRPIKTSYMSCFLSWHRRKINTRYRHPRYIPCTNSNKAAQPKMSTLEGFHQICIHINFKTLFFFFFLMLNLFPYSDSHMKESQLQK